jgi:CheY-like chemotaxis protein
VQREALRILVADDHDAMRQCVVCLLSINFLVIGAVSDGSELVEAAVCLNPDLIVSDVRMPRLNGTRCNRPHRHPEHQSCHEPNCGRLP